MLHSSSQSHKPVIRLKTRLGSGFDVINTHAETLRSVKSSEVALCPAMRKQQAEKYI